MSTNCNVFEELAEEFTLRIRNGERPSIAEYASKFPAWADQIEHLFPLLLVCEKVGEAVVDEPLPSRPNDVPDRLGDYRILRWVGQGGMGAVYEAVQEPLGRHVALKAFWSHRHANPTLIQRFRVEACAAARLHHTNIVPVFDVGEEDGIHFYAMQFIQGQSLDRVIEQVHRAESTKLENEIQSAGASSSCGRVSLSGSGKPLEHDSRISVEFGGSSRRQFHRNVASVGLQVAEALAYAHEHGIVHRDIKPSNILLDIQGRAWVSDFGLAKAEGSDVLTATGDVVGTLRYMSPERFKGQSDVLSDIYGLGVTLYELLIGQPAFDGINHAQVLLRVTTQDPVAPRRVDAKIPADLETIILKAMDKSLQRRYQSAAEMAQDLRSFIEDKPIHARRIGYLARLGRWARRNPSLTALASLLLVAAIVGFPSVTWLAMVASGEFPSSRGSRQRSARNELVFHSCVPGRS
jgi:serine/threonine protein kinase